MTSGTVERDGEVLNNQHEIKTCRSSKAKLLIKWFTTCHLIRYKLQ
jgi:hypothetical protein